MATPALRAVKKQWPSARIYVIAEEPVSRVFQHNPSISEIATVEQSASLLRLHRAVCQTGRPDIILDFLSNPRSALITALSRASERVGIAYSSRRWAYNRLAPLQDPIHPVYSAQHKLGLAHTLGIENSEYSTEFHLTDADRESAESLWHSRGWNDSNRVIAFFVHSRRLYKRWPLENFATVIRRVTTEQLGEPLLIVSPDDDSAQQVAELSAISERHLIQVRDLGELGAILQRCALLIGNDGGPKHLAVAVNTPTVTIFGAEPPAYWTPPNSPVHIALSRWQPDMKLDSHEALEQISPDEVLECARRVLSSSKR